MQISLDIWQHIINAYLYDDIRTVVHLIDCCRLYRRSLYVHHVQWNDLKKLDITAQRKYKKISSIHLRCHVKSLNMFANTLVELECYGRQLTQRGIEQLKLQKLLIHNKKICNLNHMADTLKELSITDHNKIQQHSIANLKLIKISIDDNDGITDLNHMADTLKHAHITNTKITQNGISKLRLITFDVFNADIYDLNHMADTLKYASISGTEITQDGISKLQLVKLSIYSSKINDLNHMANTLQILKCTSGLCNITQEGIAQLRLVELEISFNSNFIDLNHMAGTLKKLKLAYTDNPRQDGIAKLRLTEISLSGNKSIIDLNHMADTLKEVSCCGGILNQAGIDKLKLTSLSLIYNNFIIDIDHMVDTLKLLRCGRQSCIRPESIAKLDLTRTKYIVN